MRKCIREFLMLDENGPLWSIAKHVVVVGEFALVYLHILCVHSFLAKGLETVGPIAIMSNT